MALSSGRSAGVVIVGGGGAAFQAVDSLREVSFVEKDNMDFSIDELDM
jgi:hypothetical protein